MPLPSWALRGAGFVVNVGLLLLFVWIFSNAISATSEGLQPHWANDKERVGFATGLASYVGGIVAVTLGQRLPPPGARGDGEQPTGARERVKFRLDNLGSTIAGVFPEGLRWLRIALALGFAVVYFGVAAWAVFVWFKAGANVEVSDMVKNLVSVSAGLAFLLGRTVFYESS